MKTRTRRFKVVSYLVLLTMIVSLLGPMGTMKKVMATGYTHFIYTSKMCMNEEQMYVVEGQWYKGSIAEENIVDDIQASIQAAADSEVSLSIQFKPQDAFLSLGKDPINVKYIDFMAELENDCEIPSNIKTKSLVINSTSNPDNDYFVTYNGNLEELDYCKGKAKIIGDVSSLKLSTFKFGLELESANKLEITGDVTSAEWNKRTSIIPEDEYITGYGATEMNESIARCDSSKCIREFFEGDFSIKGSLETLNVNELFYDPEIDRDFMLLKKVISNYTSINSMAPVIVGGQLSSDIPEECIKAYSTSEWLAKYLKTKTKWYDVYGGDSGYTWKVRNSIEGYPIGEQIEVTVGENNLPLNEDLSNTIIVIHSSNKEGLVLPEGVNLSQLIVSNGKVTVRGNVDNLDVYGYADSRYPDLFSDVYVKGNVLRLSIGNVTGNENVRVDGAVSDGKLFTGYNIGAKEYKNCNFSKKSDQNVQIMTNGTINRELMLLTSNSESPLGFYIGATYDELEKAVGITDENRGRDTEVEHLFKYAGMLFEQRTINKEQMQNIINGVDLEEGFQVTDQALNIQISTYDEYSGGSEDVIVQNVKNISSTLFEIPFSIAIPDYKEGAKYGIVRVHDNGDGTTSYDVLPTSVLNGVISFSSNKFSDFVLIKNDSGNDLTAPSISNNYQKDDTSMEVTVADNESGVDAVSYTIDNGAAQTAVLTNGKFTIPSLKEGRYNVVVTAKDKSGNKSSQTIPVVSLYTVNFFYGANDDSEAFATEIVEYGNDASAPIVAKRPGFDSVGWSKSFTKVVSDIDVEALWNITGVKVTPYTGTYDRNTHNMISIDGLNPSDVVSYRTDGKLYTTNCPSVTAAGNYSVYVKIDREGLDTWYSPKYTIAVTKKAITASMINKLPTVEFNGKQYCPVPVITDGTYTLKEGTDFTLTYLNNRNSGTALVNVVGKGNYAGNVELSFQILEKKGEVKIKDNKTPQVAATNLNKLYEDETIYTPEDRQIEENGGTVNIKLEVQSQIVPVADQSKIKQMAKDKKIGLFLDISLFKMVQLAGATNGNSSQISHTNQLLSIVIPIPDEVKGRKGVELYRVHNGVPAIIPIGAENAINGEYCTIDSKNITLYVRNFSTYAIGYSTSDIKSPKTGEESSKLPWILLGFGLAAVGTGVVVRKKRKCKLILK